MAEQEIPGVLTLNKFNLKFVDEIPIGGGSFGIVVSAKNKDDEQSYAIRKIKIFGKIL